MPAGCPPTYDPEFHPDDCKRMGQLGYFACDMSTEWGITPQTLSEWARDHKEFASAYTHAKAARASWMLNKLRDNCVSSKEVTFNHHAVAMMMRYDGFNTEERAIKLKGISKCKTATEKFECLMKAFEKGDVTPKEAQTLSDVFTKEMNATDVVKIKDDIARLEQAMNPGA